MARAPDDNLNRGLVGWVCVISVALVPLLASARVVDPLNPYFGLEGLIPLAWFCLVFGVHEISIAFSRAWAIAFSKDRERWEHTRRVARRRLGFAVFYVVVGIGLAAWNLVNGSA